MPALECTTRELVQMLVGPSVQHQVPSGIPEQLGAGPFSCRFGQIRGRDPRSK